jgi:hypothetical protein
LGKYQGKYQGDVLEIYKFTFLSPFCVLGPTK